MKANLLAIVVAAWFALSIGIVVIAEPDDADAQQTGVVSIAPPQIHGFGSLSIGGTTSTLLNTLTVGPNSTPWPPVTSQVFILNNTSGILYVCPLGGTCSTAGIQIAAGNAYGFNGMATNATAYAASAGSVQAQW